ncbi:hypothetical protein [Raineyella sp.]|nr:hypothetical protein [Raineyella sp.]MEA5153643.1 hypothetical protein [Raineyella sp.]
MSDDGASRQVAASGRGTATIRRSWEAMGADGWSRAAAVTIAVLIVLLAVALRWSLRSFVSRDMSNFVVPWYDYLRQHGISAFGQGFTNYSFPYPFLLYIVSRFPLSAVTGIKVISAVFDLLLAGVAALLVRQLTGSAARGAAAGLAMLFLPTVLLNSAVWGQCDSIYTTFGLAAVYLGLRGRGNVAWALMGVALAFKLQAIFFLPVLVLLWLRRRTAWYAPAFAALAWLVLSVPPVFFGRSPGETLGVYLSQADYYQWLAAGLPNLYAWIPGADFAMFKTAGNFFSLALMGLLLLVALLAPGQDAKGVVLFGAVAAATAVYTIPQMHERYTFVYEVLVLILVMVVPRHLWLLGTSQAAALYGYSGFLMDRALVPEWVAALLLGATVVGLLTIWVLSLGHRSVGAGIGRGATRPAADGPAPSRIGSAPSREQRYRAARLAVDQSGDGTPGDGARGGGTSDDGTAGRGPGDRPVAPDGMRGSTVAGRDAGGVA